MAAAQEAGEGLRATSRQNPCHASSSRACQSAVRRQIPGLGEGGFLERSENLLASACRAAGRATSSARWATSSSSEVTACSTSPRARPSSGLLTAKRDLQIEGLLRRLRTPTAEPIKS